MLFAYIYFPNNAFKVYLQEFKFMTELVFSSNFSARHSESFWLDKLRSTFKITTKNSLQTDFQLIKSVQADESESLEAYDAVILEERDLIPFRRDFRDT